MGAQADPGGPLYVVLADGTALAPGDGTVPEGVRQTALLMLRGDAPGPGQSLTGGPATYAPIQADGRLKGFVIAAPPPISGLLREFTRVLSPQTFLLLLGAHRHRRADPGRPGTAAPRLASKPPPSASPAATSARAPPTTGATRCRWWRGRSTA